MPTDPRLQQQLFEQALERPSEERGAFLDGACSGDTELRARVQALLDAFAAATQFLTDPPPAGSSEQPGNVIDRYELLERIGEGGFGTVWLAEQLEPVRRKVAFKVIKLGMDTRQVVARFEAERQALALMDHPNIAQVFDGGITPGGRPYFVMELIHGVPITQYCDQQELSAPLRLELFQQVCHAVQHAHQKGVIHRDLKPNNILVTLHDGVPLPKVIDFGIAKATSAELTQHTMFTEHRQLVGTPEYMSPEQADPSGLDIDTRADVYSLGVLLYELLTGTKPFDSEALLDKGYVEMLRVIREEEPQKPSTRVSTRGAELAAVARSRHATPAVLSRLIRGDLDWIVMRALEKDRSRRYASAHDLAADIGRHLMDQPVEAGPPSALYRLRKFARRNRVGMLAGSMVVTALVLGIVGTSHGMVRALDEEAKAKLETERATRAAEAEARAKVEAEDSAQRAKASAARARAVLDFVVDTLQSGDPEYPSGSQGTTVLAAMDKALESLGSGRFGDDPEARAILQLAIAEIMSRNGRAAAAVPLLEEALRTFQELYDGDDFYAYSAMAGLGLAMHQLGRTKEADHWITESLAMGRRLFPEGHVVVSGALNNLALVRGSQGRLQEAEQLNNQAMEMLGQLFPGDNYSVARNLTNTAWSRHMRGDTSGAKPLFERAVAMLERLGADNQQLASSLSGLAVALLAEGRAVEAESLQARALAIDKKLYRGEHPGLARSLGNLGRIHRELDRPDAEKLLRDAKAMLERLHPNGHERRVRADCNLAALLITLGRSQDAEPLLQEALAMSKRLGLGDHPDVANALGSLGFVQLDLGRPGDAETLLRQALEMEQKIYPSDHPDVPKTLSSLGRALKALGREAEALDQYRQATEITQRLHPEDNPQKAIRLDNQGLAEYRAGHSENAVRLCAEALAMFRRLHPGEHQDVAVCMGNLAAMKFAMGRGREAAPLLRQALAMTRRLKPGDGRHTATLMDNLANLLKSLDELEEAESWCRQALAMFERLDPRGSVDVVICQRNLASIELARGRSQEAEPLLRDTLAMAAQVLPADHHVKAGLMNTLALVLQRLDRKPEAEPLLVDALAMNKRVLGDDHPQNAVVMDNLASLRLSLGRPAEAEPLGESALRIFRAAYPGGHPDTATCLVNVARIRDAVGKAVEARSAFDAAITMLRGLADGSPRKLADALWSSASARLRGGDAKAALPELEEAVELAVGVLAEADPQLVKYRETLARCRADLGK